MQKKRDEENQACTIWIAYLWLCISPDGWMESVYGNVLLPFVAYRSACSSKSRLLVVKVWNSILERSVRHAEWDDRTA